MAASSRSRAAPAAGHRLQAGACGPAAIGRRTQAGAGARGPLRQPLALLQAQAGHAWGGAPGDGASRGWRAELAWYV